MIEIEDDPENKTITIRKNGQNIVDSRCSDFDHREIVTLLSALDVKFTLSTRAPGKEFKKGDRVISSGAQGIVLSKYHGHWARSTAIVRLDNQSRYQYEIVPVTKLVHVN